MGTKPRIAAVQFHAEDLSQGRLVEGVLRRGAGVRFDHRCIQAEQIGGVLGEARVLGVAVGHVEGAPRRLVPLEGSNGRKGDIIDMHPLASAGELRRTHRGSLQQFFHLSVAVASLEPDRLDAVDGRRTDGGGVHSPRMPGGPQVRLDSGLIRPVEASRPEGVILIDESLPSRRDGVMNRHTGQEDESLGARVMGRPDQADGSFQVRLKVAGEVRILQRPPVNGVMDDRIRLIEQIGPDLRIRMVALDVPISDGIDVMPGGRRADQGRHPMSFAVQASGDGGSDKSGRSGQGDSHGNTKLPYDDDRLIIDTPAGRI